MPVLEPLAHLVDVERHLGDEDHVGAAGEPRVQRDPAGVAAHHLDDHDAVVALGRRVQAVDRVGRDLHRGVEAEREVGGREVVVDRLRHAHDVHAVAAELVRHAEGVLAADRDQRVDALAPSVSSTLATPPSVLYGFVRDVPRIVPPRCRSPRVVGDGELDGLALDDAAPAVAEADEVVAVARPRPCGRPRGSPR